MLTHRSSFWSDSDPEFELPIRTFQTLTLSHYTRSPPCPGNIVRHRGSFWQSRAPGDRGCYRVGLLFTESGSWWQTLSAFYPSWTVEIEHAISGAICTVPLRDSLTCPHKYLVVVSHELYAHIHTHIHYIHRHRHVYLHLHYKEAFLARESRPQTVQVGRPAEGVTCTMCTVRSGWKNKMCQVNKVASSRATEYRLSSPD